MAPETNLRNYAINKYKGANTATTKRITLNQVNKAIQAKFPDVILVKGEGYFYIASDEDEMALRIAHLYTSSIPVYKLNQQSIEQWVADVEELLSSKR